MNESWLGVFKHNGKIIGDILASASNEREWGVLNDYVQHFINTATYKKFTAEHTEYAEK